MPCYHPLKGFRAKVPNENGKFEIVFSGYKPDMERVYLPCGQCIGCRLERSRQWAIRCVHEQSLYDKNCFITLTYDSSKAICKGRDYSLVPDDFVKFMKRLRKAIQPEKVRFFHCGEYGEKFSRPHHHACLFGFDFPDKRLFKFDKGVRLYRSELLERLWPFGFCSVGDVTFESCAYVARYIMKKQTGENQSVYNDRVAEYVTMSRRPGIGHDWFMKFKDDVVNFDSVVIRNGVVCKPPRYYDNLYERIDPDSLEMTKQKRKDKADVKFLEILDKDFEIFHSHQERLKNYISDGLDTDSLPSPLKTLQIAEKVKLRQIDKLSRTFEGVIPDD